MAWLFKNWPLITSQFNRYIIKQLIKDVENFLKPLISSHISPSAQIEKISLLMIHAVLYKNNEKGGYSNKAL